MSVPLIAIPILNRPDLLAACVASIDQPTDTLLIIDNSAELGMGDVAEDALPSCVGELVVTEPPANLGVAASWNLAIRSYPAAPWWCLINADIEFAPGDLAVLEAAVQTRDDAISCLVEFAAFGLPAPVLDEIGWFDEQFFPVYAEDSDYRYRAKLAGIDVVDLPSATRHVGSVSYRGGPHRTDNARTYPANVDYYRAKWGGWIGEERFERPFALDVPLGYWTLDRRRLAEQTWRPRA